MSAFGYGQLDPGDFASEYAVVAFIVRQMMARMETAKLVQVTAVVGGAGAIAAAGTVDVLPLVNQIDGNGNSTPHGTVFGLPWFRLQGGQNAVVCDPVVGDIGYVVACDRDISSVRTSKARADPGSSRRFDIADGIYVGGCLNVSPTQYLVFTANGVRLVDVSGNSVALSTTGISITDLSGNVIHTSAAGMNLTDSNGNQIQMTAGIVNIVTGSFQVNGVPVVVP